MTSDQYQLLDFGEGRKLERFGPYTIDRPCPAAEGLPRTAPERWQQCDARYERGGGDTGVWRAQPACRSPWVVSAGEFQLELKLTEAGHLGLFPEQAVNWQHVASHVRLVGSSSKVLNLFGYTGGGTLAAARAGAAVVHVDAARGVVDWARRNALLSGLQSAPVRWIVEDAMTFVRREIKRGNSYDAVVLDPPSYGHGPRGEVWKLQQHLDALLAACARLLHGPRRLFLLSCHTTHYDQERLRQALATALDQVGSTGGAGRWQLMPAWMSIASAGGRLLPAGAACRAWWNAD